MRKPISARRRYEVLRRDDYTCQCCGATAPNVTLHVDHRLAVSKGGTDDLANLRAVCVTCNLGKSDMSEPVTPAIIEPDKHPLVGWAFLSYKMDGGKEVVCEQGEIQAVVPSNSPAGDLAVCDYFEWMCGQYTWSRCIHLTEFANPWGSDCFYKMFPTHNDRNSYYEWKHGNKAWKDHGNQQAPG